MKIRVTFHYDPEQPDAEDPSGMAEEECEDMMDRVGEIGGYDIAFEQVPEPFDQERSGADKPALKRQEDEQ